MEKREAKELLRKYNSGTCTDEEIALLESWYLQWETGAIDLSEKELRSIKKETFERLMQSRKRKSEIPLWRKYAAAAVVAFAMLSVGALLYINSQPEQKVAKQKKSQQLKNDVAPGGNKAVLTLADGTVVQLDEVAAGQIAETAGIKIRKTADGQVVYETASSSLASEGTLLSFNQVSTPRGGQYKVILPDGTKVWLNAASSIKYPVQFHKNGRHVELTGEGYFEVKSIQSSGKRVPFFVSTPTQTVEVLGTHFNINAYEDEKDVITTLLEGSVQVALKPGSRNANGGGKVLLKPNQQSLLTGSGFKVKTVDTEEVIAWKNGYFSFYRADLHTVMRQLSRWYDVDVVYSGEIPSETFTGKVYRNMSLSKVLDILTYAQINFRMEGRKMIITQ